MLLWHGWQVIGQGRRNAWFALSIEAGLLLLTTSVAPWLLLLPVGFALATARGRRALLSFDPLFALLVIVVLALPYLVWLVRADVGVLPPLPALDDAGGKALRFGELLGGLLLAMIGVVVLTVLNWGRMARQPEDAPVIFRPPVDPLARQLCLFLRAGSGAARQPLRGPVRTRSCRRRRRHRAAAVRPRGGGGHAATCCCCGGSSCCARCGLSRSRRRRWRLSRPTLILPWFGGAEEPTSLPARDIGRFFAESFERRTNRPLQAVAGDAATRGADYPERGASAFAACGNARSARRG